MSDNPSIGAKTAPGAPLAARCRHHPSRPAAARCPSCGGFFCRECVTEHEGLMLCANCLGRVSPMPGRRPRPFRVLAALTGFAALWGSLYLVGRLLIAIPSETHSPSSTAVRGSAARPPTGAESP